MAKFIIEQRDPAPYRGEIIKFWKEYLPGTPSKRLDWMSKGNPAGPARWFLAFEEVSGELAGILSVMPKKMSVNGKYLHGRKSSVFVSQLPIANWHDAIGEFAKARGSEEQNDPGFKEKTADIALDDYPVKADVIEFDVV